MNIPTKEEAQKLLEAHVQDEYQKYHALMVATAMEGYAKILGEDETLWYVTGLLHDIDLRNIQILTPGISGLVKEWQYPKDLSHAVEAHAYGYNGFNTLPQTKLASALMACDEISGIFYAYKKIKPSTIWRNEGQLD